MRRLSVYIAPKQARKVNSVELMAWYCTKTEMLFGIFARQCVCVCAMVCASILEMTAEDNAYLRNSFVHTNLHFHFRSSRHCIRAVICRHRWPFSCARTQWRIVPTCQFRQTAKHDNDIFCFGWVSPALIVNKTPQRARSLVNQNVLMWVRTAEMRGRCGVGRLVAPVSHIENLLRVEANKGKKSRRTIINV